MNGKEKNKGENLLLLVGGVAAAGGAGSECCVAELLGDRR